MKLSNSVLLSLLVTCDAINDSYKQHGSEVNRSQQIKKPTREHGTAIIKSFKDKDEVSFKISSKDDAHVVMASDNVNFDYSIATPGKSFKKLEKLMEEGNPGRKSKENVGGKEVDESDIKLKRGKGGELKVKAEVKVMAEVKSTKGKGKGNNSNSLAESATIAILNPHSPLNVCYEYVSLTNYVGEQIDLKIALCETDSGVVQGDGDGALSGTVLTSTVVQGGGDGVLSGTVVASTDDDGSDISTISIPPSGEDGWSLVSFTPNTAGIYSVVIDIDASSDGESFERQVHGVIAVSEKQLDSVDSVSLAMVGDSAHLAVKVVLADGYSPSEGDSFIIYADIVDGANREVVTASAIADLESDNTLQVVIQPEWFQGSNSSAYSIEYLRISNADGDVPLIIAEDIPVMTTSVMICRNRRLSETTEGRELRMAQGVPPRRSQIADHGNLRRLQNPHKSHRVIATHGYCSDTYSAWGNYDKQGKGARWIPDRLPGAEKFNDPKANRSHKKFAELLLSQMKMEMINDHSCSIIAHSQGGAAAVTLYSYWWTCLDNAPSSVRLIQSVGTPYRGTPTAAKSSASLGLVIGVGCGTNLDLTYDGAKNWMSGIPMFAREQLYYYRTTFTDYWWKRDFCSLLTDPFLSDPNDGITEGGKAWLWGGHEMGTTEGQCHTSEMRDPGQTFDMNRNREMMRYASHQYARG